MILAPAGWGFVPGTSLTEEPLPDIPAIKKMTQNEIMRALIDILIARPKFLQTALPNDLRARYPNADRSSCYTAIDYARAGKKPKPFERTSSAIAAKNRQLQGNNNVHP